MFEIGDIFFESMTVELRKIVKNPEPTMIHYRLDKKTGKEWMIHATGHGFPVIDGVCVLKWFCA